MSDEFDLQTEYTLVLSIIECGKPKCSLRDNHMSHVHLGTYGHDERAYRGTVEELQVLVLAKIYGLLDVRH